MPHSLEFSLFEPLNNLYIHWDNFSTILYWINKLLSFSYSPSNTFDSPKYLVKLGKVLVWKFT